MLVAPGIDGPDDLVQRVREFAGVVADLRELPARRGMFRMLALRDFAEQQQLRELRAEVIVNVVRAAHALPNCKRRVRSDE